MRFSTCSPLRDMFSEAPYAMWLILILGCSPCQGVFSPPQGKGDPIIFGPKSSNFYKSLMRGYFPRPCSFSGQETLGRASSRNLDCLTGFSARESWPHSRFSAHHWVRQENPGLFNHGKSDRCGSFPIGSPCSWTSQAPWGYLPWRVRMGRLMEIPNHEDKIRLFVLLDEPSSILVINPEGVEAFYRTFKRFEVEEGMEGVGEK